MNDVIVTSVLYDREFSYKPSFLALSDTENVTNATQTLMIPKDSTRFCKIPQDSERFQKIL